MPRDTAVTHRTARAAGTSDSPAGGSMLRYERGDILSISGNVQTTTMQAAGMNATTQALDSTSEMPVRIHTDAGPSGDQCEASRQVACATLPW